MAHDDELRERVNVLPSSIVLDFGMTLQHDCKVLSQLRDPILRLLLLLLLEFDNILLKSRLSVLGILQRTILRFLDNRAHCLLPCPIGQDSSAAEEFNEGRFGFVVGGVLRAISVVS